METTITIYRNSGEIAYTHTAENNNYYETLCAAILAKANLTNCNFENCKIECKHVDNEQLYSYDFTGCNFRNATFKNIVFSDINFTNCNFENANLSYQIMYICNLENAIFTNANTEHAILIACFFDNVINLNYEFSELLNIKYFTVDYDNTSVGGNRPLLDSNKIQTQLIANGFNNFIAITIRSIEFNNKRNVHYSFARLIIENDINEYEF